MYIGSPSNPNGGVTAAQAALDAVINGYSDWYLPSSGELGQIYYQWADLGFNNSGYNFVDWLDY